MWNNHPSSQFTVPVDKTDDMTPWSTEWIKVVTIRKQWRREPGIIGPEELCHIARTPSSNLHFTCSYVMKS